MQYTEASKYYYSALKKETDHREAFNRRIERARDYRLDNVREDKYSEYRMTRHSKSTAASMANIYGQMELRQFDKYFKL